ncbi:MAG: hypothetical protein ABSF70_15235 [Terracidiphilus sp.]
MDKLVVHKPSSFGIGRDIVELVAKVLAIANPMLEISCLPDLALKLIPDFVREPAFDALGAALNCLIEGGGEQNMQNFGHDREAVQQISALVAVMKECFDQQLGICGSDEESTSLIGRGSERIGIHGG